MQTPKSIDEIDPLGTIPGGKEEPPISQPPPLPSVVEDILDPRHMPSDLEGIELQELKLYYSQDRWLDSWSILYEDF